MKRFCFLLLLLICRSAQAVDPNLIAHWPMNENTGTTTADTSGNGYTGTFAGGNPAWVAGHLGYALDFNGAGDYVNVTGMGSATLDEFTICGWLKTTNAGGGMTLVSWGENGSLIGGIWLAVIPYDGSTQTSVYCYLSTAGWDTGTNGGAASNDGEWHHFAFTYDHVTKSYYRDAVLFDHDHSTSAVTLASNVFHIGSPQYAGYYTNGSWDDVRVYTRALSGTEITTLYNATSESDEVPVTAAQIIISGMGDLRWIENAA